MTYTCRDCLHYNACKSMYIHGLDDYTAIMNYQEDTFDNEHYADVYNCDDFTHKDRWAYLPYNIGDIFYCISYSNSDYFIRECQVSSIEYHNNYSGEMFTVRDLDGVEHMTFKMFSTREKAEDKLKEIKGDS